MWSATLREIQHSVSIQQHAIFTYLLQQQYNIYTHIINTYIHTTSQTTYLHYSHSHISLHHSLPAWGSGRPTHSPAVNTHIQYIQSYYSIILISTNIIIHHTHITYILDIITHTMNNVVPVYQHSQHRAINHYTQYNSTHIQ